MSKSDKHIENVIRSLYKERNSLDKTINKLLKMVNKRYLRKKMSAEQRAKISKHMKAYWRKRKNGK